MKCIISWVISEDSADKTRKGITSPCGSSTLYQTNILLIATWLTSFGNSIPLTDSTRWYLVLVQVTNELSLGIGSVSYDFPWEAYYEI